MKSKTLLLPIAVSLLFSGSYIAAKFTVSDLGPLTTSFLRYTAALVFLSVLLIRQKSDLLISKRDVPRFIGLGLTGIVGYHVFFLLAIRHTAVANTAIINALSPVITGVAAALILGERLRKSNYAGIALAFLGVVILLIRGSWNNLASLAINTGDAFMLLAVLSWTMYTLLVKTLCGRYSGLTITFYASLFGTAVLMPLGLMEGAVGQIQSISRTSVWAILYMGVGASGLGYLLYNLSVRNIGPTKTSSVVYSLVQIAVAILAFLIFGNPLTPAMILSMALIISGLRLALR